MFALDTIPMTIEAFETWVRSHDEAAVLGYSCSSLRCPLSTYLNEQMPKDRGYSAEVTQVSYAIIGREYTGPNWLFLPEWAQDFVTFIDDGSEDAGEEILAHLALTVLEQVKEQS